MFKTIRGTLTSTVIIIVAIAMIGLAVSSLMFSGYNLDKSARDSLQAKANYHAEQINAWLSGEKAMAEGAMGGILSLGTDSPDKQALNNILVGAAIGRQNLLNIYVGNEKKEFVQLDINAEAPEGYDPTQRGWYKAAVEAKATIVTDPYMDVLFESTER